MSELLFYIHDRFGSGGLRLKAYLTLIDCQRKQAADELGATRKDIDGWIEQTSRPSTTRRVSIDHWSGGYIPASSWGPDRNVGQGNGKPLPERLKPPASRADCVAGPRPCPRLACKYHLWNDNKSKFENGFPEETCALDVAEVGFHTLEEIGEVLGLTKERVRQIENAALQKLKARILPRSNENDY
jgi:hypothetical protein